MRNTIKRSAGNRINKIFKVSGIVKKKFKDLIDTHDQWNCTK